MYFGLLLATGVFFTLIAFTMFLPVMVLMPQKFSICFTLGCGFIIGSFFALRGPSSQLAHMSSKERLPFTLGFLGCMGGTIYVSMVLHSYILSVLFSALQVLALVYYAISYFPGGSAGMKFITSALTSSILKCFGRACLMEHCGGGSMKLRTQVFFALIDQGNERATEMEDTYFVYLVKSTMSIVKPCWGKTGLLAAYYKLPLNRVVVFHDDMELPCGVLRLQPRGGHGSHNGLKSVICNFRGNREFIRLRIGIGRPPGQMDPKAFLLQKFNMVARERIDAALKEGVDVLKVLASKGFNESARCFNREQKYKHLRLSMIPEDIKNVSSPMSN